MGGKEKTMNNRLESPPHTTDGNNCAFCWKTYTGVIDRCINGHYGHMHAVQMIRRREEEILEQECDLCSPDLITRI